MAIIPTKDELQKAYDRGQAYVKEYVTSAELNKAFEDIRESHKLHFDEADKLTDALVSVFLELRSVEQFPNLLKEALEQNSDTYDAVLQDVNEKIFKVFRKKLAGAGDTPESEPEQGATHEQAIERPVGAAIHSAPLVVPETQPATPVQPQSAPTEKKTSERPEQISVDTLDGDVKKSAPERSGVQYHSGIDPYREQIEE